MTNNPAFAPFWRRPALDRRVFFRHLGAAVAGSFFLPGRSLETIARANAPVKGTARYVIFVNMAGAPSHVDTFDFKEGPWTPPEMQPETYGRIRWPRGLLPRLADHLDSIALIRSARTHAGGSRTDADLDPDRPQPAVRSLEDRAAHWQRGGA